MKTLNPDKKIYKSFAEVETIISSWKNDGLSIVFTNGCFDIIHKGHIEYLYASANLGDKLIIGLNTDESIKNIKGKKRPIINQSSRAYVLAALGSVDAVVLFSENTPLNLIKLISPNILVKGSDYNTSEMIGGEYMQSRGGQVLTVPISIGYSTSLIIDKILKL